MNNSISEQMLKELLSKTIKDMLNNYSNTCEEPHESDSVKQGQIILRWLKKSNNIKNIVQSLRENGSLSSVFVKISERHKKTTNKLFKNFANQKNWPREFKSECKKITDTEMQALSSMAVIMYILETTQVNLKEALKKTIFNKGHTKNKNNFNENDYKSLLKENHETKKIPIGTNTESNPKQQKQQNSKTAKQQNSKTAKKMRAVNKNKMNQKNKKRRAVNKNKMKQLLKEMKTSSITMQQTDKEGKKEQVTFQKLKLNQICKTPNSTLTSIATKAARQQQQHIEIKGRECYFTSKYCNDEIENVINGILKGNSDEERKKMMKKAKQIAKENWKDHHAKKKKKLNVHCPTLCCKICKVLINKLPTFRERGISGHQNIHKKYFNLKRNHNNMLFPIHSVLTKK